MGTKSQLRPFSGASVYTSVNITIPNATVLVVPWNSEHFDTDNYHQGPFTVRLTVPSDGLYRVTVNHWFFPSALGSRFGSFRQNGFQNAFCFAFRASDLGGTVGTGSLMFEALAGDFFTTHVFQNSGGALALLGTVNNSRFQIQRLGDLP